MPFTWRKKWERDWDQVLYCSDRCRAAAGAFGRGGAHASECGAWAGRDVWAGMPGAVIVSDGSVPPRF
ncbi:DUF2256 domain-containing protein [Deinococcus sp. RIT780]|uniref:DUF2256 domain-containing protein n=1 Tax=Deinococcus sp. RIT780 TaxID=2870472 RepID=UPI0021084FE4|nr:DUF2256 domain-containing protein [Deinococcus sp. RIT780]